MSCKFIFVTGGVVSSLGKGIAASSIARILSKEGYKVFMMKFDPYLNIDPGTMSPYQHGEVFVTDDGAETDLDLGHYERFADLALTKESSVTSGKIYSTILEKERRGDYLGSTVQVIPHVTGEIKDRLKKASKISKADIIIAEIGGTVGDIESLPFIEAIRQARLEFGYENTLFIHNTLVPYLKTTGEVKSKPTQHSVKELSSMGIQPDIIILRSEANIDKHTREKISLFCNVPVNSVFVCKDVKYIYQVALELHKQKIEQIILSHFNLENREIDMSDWENLISKIDRIDKEVNIALVGKYVKLHDAYISVSCSLTYAGYFFNHNVKISWVDSEKLESMSSDEIEKVFCNIDGIIVPGGFGQRGCEGMKIAIRFAREKNIPFLGICLGMQMACVEYANNVLKKKKANTTEFDSRCSYPVISYLPDQYRGIKLGGTMRLGAYKCKIKSGTKAYEAYNEKLISERHRHRFEFNNKYLNDFDDGNFIVSGTNPHTGLVEMIELKNHPFFLACQFHPEFKSRPLNPHPLFKSFIKASIDYQDRKNIK